MSAMRRYQNPEEYVQTVVCVRCDRVLAVEVVEARRAGIFPGICPECFAAYQRDLRSRRRGRRGDA